MDDITRQLKVIHDQHLNLIDKLTIIKQKIEIMLSKEGGKNKEIQKLIKSIDKIKKNSGLSDETFKTINETFEHAKKMEDEEEKIRKLTEVKESYSVLIKTINEEKINKIKSEINSIINSIEKSLEKYKDDKTVIENEFNGFKKIYKNTVDIDGFIKLKNDLEEMNISRFGKIKVYMKIRPTPGGGDSIVKEGDITTINNFFQINNDQTIVIKSDTTTGKDNNFGPFSKVLFNTKGGINTTKNVVLFDEMSGENSPLNLDSLLGRSTILFGYGISGSGKSWTILGGEGDPGLIPLLIKSLETAGVEVKPFKIFEHYLNSNDFIDTDGANPFFVKDKKLKSNIREFTVKVYKKDESPLIDFIKLDKDRKDLFSIKKTPNNPSSSRTHLFIIYEIKKDGKTGYIIFIDSAGKEEPLEIAKQFYTKSKEREIENPALPFVANKDQHKSASYTRLDPNSIKLEDVVVKKSNPPLIEKQLDFVKQVIREGFFINESLAHMIYYFTGENISDEVIIDKTKTKFVREYKSYDDKGKLNIFYKPPLERITKKIDNLNPDVTKDPIMITTIFEYLTNLCTIDNQKKFKFVMLGNTRTEERYRDDIIKTLKLVDLLKST